RRLRPDRALHRIQDRGAASEWRPRDARLFRWPYALHRWWLSVDVGRPPNRRDAAGIRPSAQRVRVAPQAGRVDHGWGLVSHLVAGRAVAAAQLDRLGHAEQSGVREPA